MAKNNSELKGIQKKLVAAVAMVLVACIMVVSSSYAWFTLSTAPEVKGIQTSVGSNGNLEMALRTIANVNNITNTTSGGTFPAANTFWGNLVDLEDESYGLSGISLAPARLNLVNGKINVAASYLKTAVYGTDGRVSGLEPNTFAGVYSASENGFVAGAGYGVRGIGTKSGMTEGELALRNARTAVTEAKGAADFLAETSLRDDAVKLANIIINNQLDASATFTQTDYDNLANAIARLEAIVTALEGAMKATVVPVAVVKGQNVTANDVTITASSITVTGVTDQDWTDLGLAALKTQIQNAWGVAQSIKTKLEGATTALSSVTKDGSYTFDELSAPMTKILSTNDMKIGGKTFTEWGGDKIQMGLAITSGKPIELVQGIYSDIALFKGNYNVNTTIVVNGTFDGVGSFNNTAVDVNISAVATAPVNGSYYLTYFLNQLSSLKAEGGESSGAITDLYAYAVDLAFRTNAAGSYLKLQSAAADRVYQQNAPTDSPTQGGGSYMKFDIQSTGYTVDQLVELMKAIRVVFFNYEDGSIHGVAALDMTEGNYTATTTSVKANLVMYNYTTDGDLLVLTTAKTGENAEKIVDLTQNQAIGISSLVFLDGDLVENSDVGISGKTATGTMNLQFASSATLDPMDYTFTADETTNTTTPTTETTGPATP